MKRKSLFLVMLILFILSACASRPVTKTTSTEVATAEAPTMALTEAMGPEATAELAVTALVGKDLAALADLVHPEMGVRFSHYAYVEEEQQVFMADQIPGLFNSDEVYHWGVYDGSGQILPFNFDYGLLLAV